MTYFPHYISSGCLSSYDKYITNKKYKTRFIISKKKSIPIFYQKIDFNTVILMKIKHAIPFMNFIIKKTKNEKLFCRNIVLSADYNKYFDHILTNNMVDQIKIFLKKYIPFIESSYSNEGLCSIFNDKYKTLSNETLYLVINSFSIFTLSKCINSGIGGPKVNHILTLDIKILKKLLRLYIKKLTKCLTSDPKYFTKKYHIESKNISTNMYFTDLREISKICAHRNNPEFFEYALEKLSSFIDTDDVKNDILYDQLYEYFEYDKDVKMELFYSILFNCAPCPEIYEILISDFEVEFLKNKIVCDIVDEVSYLDDKLFCLESILFRIYSKMGIDQEFIDDLFLKSQYGSKNVIKILVEYGADYERYGKKLIKKAKKQNNKEVINYVKKLLENGDE
ncbi:hypothetical protein QJ854_gp928 [Moumouvirus goulette]|uniref:Repeat protein n=1 Tax=Moumouvirus goulette TaxID=1247379 RepID=M1PAG7_9VIRU|nr:hypothetical protein QJ854_gp928 [Moumouvirus goulette]AGF84854.1 hypothetical protein glt_00045 [Moumouvirus goulette]